VTKAFSLVTLFIPLIISLVADNSPKIPFAFRISGKCCGSSVVPAGAFRRPVGINECFDDWRAGNPLQSLPYKTGIKKAFRNSLL
jgi:hypothetical protein